MTCRNILYGLTLKTLLVLPSFLSVTYLPDADHQGNQGHQGVCNSAKLDATVDRILHRKRFCCKSLF